MKQEAQPRDLPRDPGDKHAKPQDHTQVSRSPGEPDPRLPHERDESADVAVEPQPRIEQAKKDVDRGLVDTDRGPPMDDAYEKQKR